MKTDVRAHKRRINNRKISVRKHSRRLARRAMGKKLSVHPSTRIEKLWSDPAIVSQDEAIMRSVEQEAQLIEDELNQTRLVMDLALRDRKEQERAAEENTRKLLEEKETQFKEKAKTEQKTMLDIEAAKARNKVKDQSKELAGILNKTKDMPPSKVKEEFEKNKVDQKIESLNRNLGKAKTVEGDQLTEDVGSLQKVYAEQKDEMQYKLGEMPKARVASYEMMKKFEKSPPAESPKSLTQSQIIALQKKEWQKTAKKMKQEGKSFIEQQKALDEHKKRIVELSKERGQKKYEVTAHLGEIKKEIAEKAAGMHNLTTTELDEIRKYGENVKLAVQKGESPATIQIPSALSKAQVLEESQAEKQKQHLVTLRTNINKEINKVGDKELSFFQRDHLKNLLEEERKITEDLLRGEIATLTKQEWAGKLKQEGKGRLAVLERSLDSLQLDRRNDQLKRLQTANKILRKGGPNAREEADRWLKENPAEDIDMPEPTGVKELSKHVRTLAKMLVRGRKNPSQELTTELDIGEQK